MIKLIEKIWAFVVVVTLVSTGINMFFFPFESHGRVWAILLMSEIAITMLYNILFKDFRNKH